MAKNEPGESDRGKRAGFDPVTGEPSGSGSGAGDPNENKEDYDNDLGNGAPGPRPGRQAASLASSDHDTDRGRWLNVLKVRIGQHLAHVSRSISYCAG